MQKVGDVATSGVTCCLAGQSTRLLHASDVMEWTVITNIESRPLVQMC
jgi:hypothetical protein